MFGIAIIGCGDMGTKHAAAWGKRADARIVSVCDLQADRADTLATRHGAQRYARWQDAVTCDGVDIVSICVPACDHRDVAVAAASNSCHVLCEKPMALTLEQADEMIAAAKAHGVHLSVCHQYRSLSRFRVMKRLIDEGRLGEPLFIRFTELREVRPKLAMHSLSKNGGPVHDMSGHLFDLGRYLTGREAEAVNAVGTILARGKERTRSVTDFGIDTIDIQVRFQGGHCLSIGINWGLPEGTPGNSNDLVSGPLGAMFTVDLAHPDRFLGDLSDSVGVALKDAAGTTMIACDIDHEGPEACVEALVGSILGKGASQYSWAEGRAALRLILAAIESAETGEKTLINQ